MKALRQTVGTILMAGTVVVSLTATILWCRLHGPMILFCWLPVVTFLLGLLMSEDMQ